MDIDQIKQLMTHLEESKLKKLVFKKGDFELHLEKESAQPLYPQRPRLAPVEPEPAFASETSLKGNNPARNESQEGIFVTSPMVGTYYPAPAPGQPPFVKVGDRVTEHTVVCIIEAMKVMNEVKAGVNGIVAEILTDGAQPVEFGTRLLRIT